MKVKFLRKYGKNEIGIEKVINVNEQEKAYLLSTGTIEILEDDAVEDKNDTQEEDIPKVPVNEENSEKETQEPPKEEEKAGKNGKRGSNK